LKSFDRGWHDGVEATHELAKPALDQGKEFGLDPPDRAVDDE
jgi:hypothetical protein